MKGLEAYYKLSWENACKRCQYFNNHLTQCFNEGDCIWLDIEKELKALQIIRETPEFAWYVKTYKNAYEMVSDVKGFRVDESVEELQEKFDLLKEVLHEKEN